MLRPFSWPLALLAPAAVALAGLSGSYIMPQEHDAIQYSKGPVDDAVARLQQRMDSGQVRLRYEHEFGYLRSVLKELNVSTTSQVLVFSKTSFQAPKIAPRTPRALYFNDSVTVGFVRTGEVLEFAAIDPKQGVMFYTLDQEQAAHPRFDRRDVCLQCHLSGASMGVPGFMVRSITPDRTGMPVMSEGGFITDHRSPLRDRWGGWYVTGTSGDQSHMGNAVVQYPTEDPKLPISQRGHHQCDRSASLHRHGRLCVAAQRYCGADDARASDADGESDHAGGLGGAPGEVRAWTFGR
jgi:hypothetical protein